ncbi:Carbonic anhydrase or acetyltransferase, isoleucine patch superfamily [Methylomagnum ishizawai]|uniref:Carbonic anhydrase or acetyltransferase, isoleucine patch superfamily n=1 Tax=Methylomagnum ishizawai TaxID=1760988 RepID=A0A1Y6CYL9_9GAMM|nr:gamma carbonic anhydrase family protein [Methylomagnum ishizawai]SMF93653.1 Carbonic anhydrase or acetyltransferase, isoleucine patch superfamily [Methylomagnum ishizawai]
MAVQSFHGTEPKLGAGVYIAESAVVIGDVGLGKDVSIWPTSVVRGDVNLIEIGDETNIQDGSVLHVTHRSASNPEGHPLVIGNGVTVGHRVVLHGCRIGDLCLIGIGAIIMDGAVVEERVIVGAGTLVPPGKRLESGFLYVGAPAKQVRTLKDEELEYLSYSKDGYVLLKNQYLRDAGLALS